MHREVQAPPTARFNANQEMLRDTKEQFVDRFYRTTARSLRALGSLLADVGMASVDPAAHALSLSHVLKGSNWLSDSDIAHAIFHALFSQLTTTDERGRRAVALEATVAALSDGRMECIARRVGRAVASSHEMQLWHLERDSDVRAVATAAAIRVLLHIAQCPEALSGATFDADALVVAVRTMEGRGGAVIDRWMQTPVRTRPPATAWTVGGVLGLCGVTDGSRYFALGDDSVERYGFATFPPVTLALVLSAQPRLGTVTPSAPVRAWMEQSPVVACFVGSDEVCAYSARLSEWAVPPRFVDFVSASRGGARTPHVTGRLDGTPLSGIFSDCDFTGASVRGCSVSRASFERARMSFVDATGATFASTSFRFAHADALSARGAAFNCVDFGGCDARCASFAAATFSACDASLMRTSPDTDFRGVVSDTPLAETPSASGDVAHKPRVSAERIDSSISRLLQETPEVFLSAFADDADAATREIVRAELVRLGRSPDPASGFADKPKGHDVSSKVATGVYARPLDATFPTFGADFGPVEPPPSYASVVRDVPEYAPACAGADTAEKPSAVADMDGAFSEIFGRSKLDTESSTAADRGVHRRPSTTRSAPLAATATSPTGGIDSGVRPSDSTSSKLAAVSATARLAPVAAVGALLPLLNGVKSLAARTVDLVIMLDVTHSMEPWRAEAANRIIEVVNDAQQLASARNLVLRIGVVLYRDYDPLRDDTWRRVERFRETPDKAVDRLRRTTVSAGFDDAEDVGSALAAALSLEWKGLYRLVVHVCDAPPHGRIFHDGSETKKPTDRYVDDAKAPARIPNSAQTLDLLAQMCRKRIDYTLVRVGDEEAMHGTEKMERAFRQCYEETASAAGQEPTGRFDVRSLGRATEAFASLVLSSVSSSVCSC